MTVPKVHYDNVEMTRNPKYTVCNMYRIGVQYSPFRGASSVIATTDLEMVTCKICLKRVEAFGRPHQTSVSFTRDERKFILETLRFLVFRSGLEQFMESVPIIHKLEDSLGLERTNYGTTPANG